MNKKAKKKQPTGEVLSGAFQNLRKDLMKQLKGVDTNILVSIVRQHGTIAGLPEDFFSDWPDSYNRSSWYKTWAKAELAEIPEIAVRPEKNT